MRRVAIERRAKIFALVLTLSFGAGATEEPNDFVYQLQRIDPTAIGKTKFDLVIIDYSRDGSDERKFTADQISASRPAPAVPRPSSST